MEVVHLTLKRKRVTKGITEVEYMRSRTPEWLTEAVRLQGLWCEQTAAPTMDQAGLLEDPISLQPFGCSARGPHTPLVLDCGHTFTRQTVANVCPLAHSAAQPATCYRLSNARMLSFVAMVTS